MSIWLTQPALEASRPCGRDAGSGRRPSAPLYELIELFFFAYRDFVGDADRILGRLRLRPGASPGPAFRRPQSRPDDRRTLDILKITKQSLNRVLKELIEQGFVEQRARARGPAPAAALRDAQGRELALDLARLQTRRIAARLAEIGPDGDGGRRAAFSVAHDRAGRARRGASRRRIGELVRRRR